MTLTISTCVVEEKPIRADQIELLQASENTELVELIGKQRSPDVDRVRDGALRPNDAKGAGQPANTRDAGLVAGRTPEAKPVSVNRQAPV